MYKKHFKRFFDLIISIFALFILAPIILTLIVLLFIANNGKIFFFQERPGYKALPFKIIKFKTMNDIYDEQKKMLPDEKRITKIGRFIRSSSMDEILQLLNVIKGDMSLVGPRPLMMQYLNRYNAEQSRRHEVMPGITGWAQVNGRNTISWEQKFKYDIEYVEKQSFIFDLKILCMTFFNVVQRKDTVVDVSILKNQEFMGNN